MNRKADFFYKTNRFESIRITNRIDSNRELECSSCDPHHYAALQKCQNYQRADPGICVRGPSPVPFPSFTPPLRTPPILSSPFPSFCSPFLPLGSRVPLKPAKGSGEHRPITNLVHSRVVRKPLVAVILSILKCMSYSCHLSPIVISFSSPTLSFITDLKPSFFLQILPIAAFCFSSSALTT